MKQVSRWALVFIVLMVAGCGLDGKDGKDGDVYLQFDWVFTPSYSDNNPSTPSPIWSKTDYKTDPGTYTFSYGGGVAPACTIAHAGTYTISAHAGTPGESAGTFSDGTDGTNGADAKFTINLWCNSPAELIQTQLLGMDLAELHLKGMLPAPAHDQAREMMSVVAVPNDGSQPIVTEQIIGDKKIVIKTWQVLPR